MSDLESYPRDELLSQLGWLPPSKKVRRVTEREQPRRRPEGEIKRLTRSVQVPQSPKSRTTNGLLPLPDLSTLPPARGVGRPNQVGQTAARKEYREKRAAKAEQVREPKVSPGRAVPRRAPNVHSATNQVQDAE